MGRGLSEVRRFVARRPVPVLWPGRPHSVRGGTRNVRSDDPHHPPPTRTHARTEYVDADACFARPLYFNTVLLVECPRHVAQVHRRGVDGGERDVGCDFLLSAKWHGLGLASVRRRMGWAQGRAGGTKGRRMSWGLPGGRGAGKRERAHGAARRAGAREGKRSERGSGARESRVQTDPSRTHLQAPSLLRKLGFHACNQPYVWLARGGHQ